MMPWFEEARFIEVAAPDNRAKRRLDLHVRLLGAYHDGWIDLRYRDVTSYRLVMQPRHGAPRGDGHRDWRYDEFRVTADGRVEHEIEWWSAYPTSTWLIEAADVSHEWQPWPAEGAEPAGDA